MLGVFYEADNPMSAAQENSLLRFQGTNLFSKLRIQIKGDSEKTVYSLLEVFRNLELNHTKFYRILNVVNNIFLEN